MPEETYVYNSCVLSAIAETWPLAKQAQNKFAVAQSKMKRMIMSNITHKDRRTSIVRDGGQMS